MLDHPQATYSLQTSASIIYYSKESQVIVWSLHSDFSSYRNNWICYKGWEVYL